MIRVLHISTECYPAAKAGGMGDVVGALPLYSQSEGIEASVVIPMYALAWFKEQKFKAVYQGSFQMGMENIQFEVLKLDSEALAYAFFCISFPGKFDRDSVYLAEDGEGFKDEVERNTSFQRAVLHWVNNNADQFDLLHCHDHQSGLIPFFASHGYDFEYLRNTPTYYTIHNAAYRGMWDWRHKDILPEFNEEHIGLLDWDHHIHSFATAIKCCWGYSTVSPSYLKEIAHNSGNLNWLYDHTKDKARGILNGIDTAFWNPKKDSFLDQVLKRSWKVFKTKNKEALCLRYGLDKQAPLFSFIGRLAYQKGADILTEAISNVLAQNTNATFIVLGSGSHELETAFRELEYNFGGRVKALIMYNEEVAHTIYAGSDYLLMPSRFEPCGLNQMFAMRYGTIPVVHSTGGLVDTVTDVAQGGCGIRFDEADFVHLRDAILRAVDFYK
ncbi:MAG: glycogen synthase, partial [Saprospiraceae bacterium]|nr:glycogen synthase [Saprospiraceae bacterium]